jgi:HEAT repeat protein
MRESKSRRHLSIKRKDRSVPLAKLRTSEAVRTVVAHPRRMAELFRLLEDSDQSTRQRVGSALSRLADACPERLIRWADRIQKGLGDESAYLRWHLVYVLGRVVAAFPGRCEALLEMLIQALDDENRVVRVLSFRSLAGVGAAHRRAVESAFAAKRRDLPPELSRALQAHRATPASPRRH